MLYSREKKISSICINILSIDSMSRSRKYTHDEKKYMLEQIQNLKDPEHYSAIFEILCEDPKLNFRLNGNDVYLNLAVATNKTLIALEKKLAIIYEEINSVKEEQVDVVPFSSNDSKNRAYKLSNYEKNLIKQRKLKKVLDEEADYAELDIKSKDLKKKSVGKTKKMILE